MKKVKVFNIEFDGMDKSGKDSIMNQMRIVAPNKYISRARGVLSQVAFAKMFNRNYNYEIYDGYIDNTLVIYLTVDEDDWNVRCALTHEHELNALRSDVESAITYKKSKEAFDSAYRELKMNFNPNHFITFNTTKMTPFEIIKRVVEKIEELNK